MKTEFSQKMTCYKPIDAWHSEEAHVDTGKRYLVFTCPFPCRARFAPIAIPCGRCIGCRLDHSRDWAIRCVHEASLSLHNCFITLTYNDEHLPLGESLLKSDFQKFMKRLRKQNEPKILRYFMCGEYGDNNMRPHYHSLLFNHHFPDQLPHKKTDAGNIISTSETLNKLWGKGHAYIGECSYQSAGYISRYVIKKRTGPEAKKYYETVTPAGEIINRLPEYIDMSRRPGIAKPWFDKFHRELYISDQVIIEGRKKPVPKYYDKLVKEQNPGLLADIKELRKENHLKHAEDNTPERLAVREQLKERQAQLLQRNLNK